MVLHLLGALVRWVGTAGGWLFLVWSVAGVVAESRRRQAMQAKSTPLARGGATQTQQMVGALCPRCKSPKLPPGMVAPDYLRACTCPPLPAGEVLAGRPPRP